MFPTFWPTQTSPLERRSWNCSYSARRPNDKRGDDLVGVFSIRKSKVQPFTDKQIELVTTFADQAVIAIENVRLFKELQERTRELMESVEEMKAARRSRPSSQLHVGSPDSPQYDCAHAVQLSGTNGGVIYEYDEAAQEFHLRASDRMEERSDRGSPNHSDSPGQGATGQTVSARAASSRLDLLAQREIGDPNPADNGAAGLSIVTSVRFSAKSRSWVP